MDFEFYTPSTAVLAQQHQNLFWNLPGSLPMRPRGFLTRAFGGLLVASGSLLKACAILQERKK